MTELERVSIAIAQAAYPDVHPDFTDAGWERMARAAINEIRNPSQIDWLETAAILRETGGTL